jgi:hypothetical protein
MAALLIEGFIAKASFSPGNQIEYQPQYMARNGVRYVGIEG